jgi:sulfur carrier protein ThiS
MRIHLGGHLNWYDAQKRAWLVQRQSEPITLFALAQQLGLPAAEIAIVAVNGRACALETTVVTDSDKVEFYPPLGGG